MNTIGCVGLGNMNLPMSRNLVAAGHQVAGFDAVPDALVAARAHGIEAAHRIEVADSAAGSGRGAEVAIAMLPAGERVRAIVCRP